MNIEQNVTCKACCAVCLRYTTEECPLTSTIDSAKETGDDEFDHYTKFYMACPKFTLDPRLNPEKQSII